MTTPVELYVYDLSNGMARQISLQLTGRQMDGIWHTSVVVFGKEIFYGPGIKITLPGKSHHGSPLRIVNMGETAIDEDTLGEYIAAMRDHYTADKYHLLDFNCNTFSNACIEFLTGGSIPSYITSLPRDFLSTPLGTALRPTIDAMFTDRPATNGVPARPTASMAPNPALVASLLGSAAAQATTVSSSPGGAFSAPVSAAAPPTIASTPASMHAIANPTSFHSLLRANRAVIAFFTSATCGPCRMIEPVFMELARSKNRPSGGVGFAKIDLSVGLGGAVGREYDVRATPTFIFFLNGRKTHELRGVNAPELRTQTDLLIYQAFPPHAHMMLSLPAVEAISLDPILVKGVPNLDKVIAKLAGFIDGATSWTGKVTQSQVKQTLTKTVLPFLKASTATPRTQQPKLSSFSHWSGLTTSLAASLGPSELFPLVDIWRIALLNPEFAAWNATKKVSEGPLRCLVDEALKTEGLPRNYQLTVLQMVANAFSNQVLARDMIVSMRTELTKLLVDALLHDDAGVRTAAASVGFNIAAHLQKARTDTVRVAPEEDEEWEQELVVAILGAIERETGSEDTVHRLTASLGLLLRLSPYTEQLSGLLDALGAKETLRAKMGTGAREEVRKLVAEVADKLC